MSGNRRPPIKHDQRARSKGTDPRTGGHRPKHRAATFELFKRIIFVYINVFVNVFNVSSNVFKTCRCPSSGKIASPKAAQT